MTDTNRFLRTEAVMREEPTAPAGQIASIPPAVGARPGAFQAEAPAEGAPEKSRKRSLLRRGLTWVGALLLLYFLAAFAGLVPVSYSSSQVAGLNVVVVSYYPSISGLTTPEMTRIQTGGQTVIVRDRVVDLGSGHTVRVPDWCDEVRVTVRWGSVSVTFTPR